MKKILILALGLFAVAGCASNNSLDQNNEYRSQQQDSPNVGSRAYSGAEFPAENTLTPKPAPQPAAPQPNTPQSTVLQQ